MVETLHAMKLRHKQELKLLQNKSVKGKGAKQALRDEEKSLLQKQEDEIKQLQANKQHTDDNIDENNHTSHDNKTDTDNNNQQQATTTTQEQQQQQPELKIAEQIASMSLYNFDKQPKELTSKQLKKQRKQQREQQRNEQIKYEVSNMNDKRNDENSKLNNILQQHNLSIKQVSADGNCMFSAISDQLSYIHESRYYDQQSLRELSADYIKQHKNDFVPYIHNDNDNNETIDIEQYCKSLTSKRHIQWGSHTELVALSAALQRPIHIYNANSDKPIIVEHSSIQYTNIQPIRLSYHQHYYTLGEHYNSVIDSDLVISDSDNDNDNIQQHNNYDNSNQHSNDDSD